MSEPTQQPTSNTPKEVVLRVSEAKPRDAGKKRVRIDPDVMKELGVEAGDVVEIEGKRKTAAIVWPSLPEDLGLDIIRMDGTLRRNADVNIGDKVIVRKANPKPATKVRLAPTVHSMSIDDSFKKYVKKKLVGLPVVENDIIPVPVLGQAVQLVVIDTRPRGVVIITEKTTVDILEKPVTATTIPKVTYEDIGGLHEVIAKIRELVELPLRHPELFQRLGIEPPKGILLYGPPGTGKTLLAKAVATESGANFIAIRGPEVLSKWVGESEKAVREVFRRAREVAPAVVFFDEIDSIAPVRGQSFDSGVTDRIVNQLLTEMDGIVPLSNVVILAATNRPDILDPALLRPGRFDRVIYVPPPDKEARKQILKIHTKKVPLANDVDLDRLAELTEGYTGADLAALVREAALLKLREKLEPGPVEWRHFEQALKKVRPSLTRDDIVRYEQMADRLKKLIYM